MKSALKAVAGLTASVSAAVVLVAIGFGVASVTLTDPGPHKFAHLDAPLWTSAPEVVDVAAQHYERLPALVGEVDVPASGLPDDTMVAGKVIRPDGAPVASAGSEGATGSADASSGPAMQQTADAGGTPGDGAGSAAGAGQGIAGSAAAATTVAMPASYSRATSAGADGAASNVSDHDGWCAARYRSWRPDDNTYQPFDGGPRRACISPYG